MNTINNNRKEKEIKTVIAFRNQTVIIFGLTTFVDQENHLSLLYLSHRPYIHIKYSMVWISFTTQRLQQLVAIEG